MQIDPPSPFIGHIDQVWNGLLQMCHEPSCCLPQVFYWAALAGNGNRRVDNILKHGTNNALILLDIVLSRVPFVSYHFQVHTDS